MTTHRIVITLRALALALARAAACGWPAFRWRSAFGSALLRRGPRLLSDARTRSRMPTSPRSICRRSMSTLMTCTRTLSPSRYTCAGVLAAQHVRALDEPVVVVGHRRDVDHAFDEVLDQLDEQAEGGDAGDVAVELVADLVRHEADLLPLDQLALGLGGAPLALGGVPAHLRQVLGQLLDPLLRHPRRATRGACGGPPGPG